MASSKSEPATTKDATKATAKSAGDPKVVSYEEALEYGYVGEVHPEKNNDDYTVAGVSGSTANVADQPTGTSVDARAKWAPLQKP